MKTCAICGKPIDSGAVVHTECVPRWISVNIDLPKPPIDKRGYLCRGVILGYPIYMVLKYFFFEENPHFQHEALEGMRVTHWMQLPEPPKEAEL